MLDAGHGPETPGKRSPDGTIREFHFNAAVADEVKKLLMAKGMHILFSHQNDKDVPLAERITLANQLQVHAFISIHANAFGAEWNTANGIETYVYPKASADSVTLAHLIQPALVLACNRKNRGVKTANFAVLRETKMPAILIECGFMTHREEADLLKQRTYQVQCAEAIAFGIQAWRLRKQK